MNKTFIRGSTVLTVLLALTCLPFSGLTLAADSLRATSEESAQPDTLSIKVYKSPTCGCCGEWVDHLEQNGFTVSTHNLNTMSLIKEQLGVPSHLQSCHTAVIGNYLVEGHVPADDIKRMVQEGATIKGLSVPGMPIGSPGMEMGARKDPYKVISFQTDGSTGVVNEYPGNH